MRVVVFVLLCCGFAHAQDDADWGNDDAADDWAEPAGEAATDVGWGDDDDSDDWGEAKTTRPVEAPSNWSLTGFFRSDYAVRTRRLGELPFAKARQSLDLGVGYKSGGFRLVAEGHAEYDPAYLVSRDEYDQPTLETYEARLLNGEQFVSYAAGPTQLTLGRQIVAWGEGDVISPLDIVNPRDLREPGMVDLDDLRLSVLASRVGYFVGDHRLEAMVVHEAYFGERPPPLGEFSPLRSQVTSNPQAALLLGDKEMRYVDVQDRFAADAQSFFLRWIYKGPGLDFGLYAASALDQQGVVLIDPAQVLASDAIDIELDHRRYTLVGLSGATAKGSWLYKWEAAGAINKVFNVGDPSSFTLETAEGSLVTLMGGATYTGISDTQIGFEASKGIFVDEPDDLLFEVDAPQFALRITHNAMRETLIWSGAVTAFGLTAEQGALARAQVDYKIVDGMKIGGGYVLFVPAEDGENGLLTGMDEHDRAFCNFRIDF